MTNDASAEPPISSKPLLEARGLCKFYGTHEVLHDIDVTIRAREIVTLVGPNGAGKTTLLSCLLGLETPDNGEVVRAPDLRVGYVPQHFRPQASLPLTTLSFLLLYAPQAGGRIASLAAQLQVEDVLNRQLVALSGGELRRVLLLRALLRLPQLLVLDEPTQGVDVAGQGDLYRLLKRLSDEQGFAVLMVSHDLYVVMAQTDRVICLNHHICCEGTPRLVGGDPAFRELFGEDLAKQLAMYHHQHDHRHGVHEDHFAHDHAHGEHDHG